MQMYQWPNSSHRRKFHGNAMQCNKPNDIVVPKRSGATARLGSDVGLLRPECAKRASSVNVQSPCLQKDLRTGSILRDMVNFSSELCRRRSVTFLRKSHIWCRLTWLAHQTHVSIVQSGRLLGNKILHKKSASFKRLCLSE